jgi:hypothetical protein
MAWDREFDPPVPGFRTLRDAVNDIMKNRRYWPVLTPCGLICIWQWPNLFFRKRHKIVKPLQIAAVRPAHYLPRIGLLGVMECAMFWP